MNENLCTIGGLILLAFVSIKIFLHVRWRSMMYDVMHQAVRAINQQVVGDKIPTTRPGEHQTTISCKDIVVTYKLSISNTGAVVEEKFEWEFLTGPYEGTHWHLSIDGMNDESVLMRRPQKDEKRDYRPRCFVPSSGIYQLANAFRHNVRSKVE